MKKSRAGEQTGRTPGGADRSKRDVWPALLIVGLVINGLESPGHVFGIRFLRPVSNGSPGIGCRGPHEVGNKGHGTGFCGGFCPGDAV
ncbi:MAG: hypothetical protein LBE17_06110 [Treponema sp.]|nr:hypothetical protein [Treponema sp.]